ncbi:hypothetical protein CsSME_00019907 [Camellia sinensis var. sinensis]
MKTPSFHPTKPYAKGLVKLPHQAARLALTCRLGWACACGAEHAVGCAVRLEAIHQYVSTSSVLIERGLSKPRWASTHAKQTEGGSICDHDRRWQGEAAKVVTTMDV